MRARLQEQQCELAIVLLPRHQPVGLDVALPLPLMVALELRSSLLTLDNAQMRFGIVLA